jgi:type IV pilus assembly protein PilA
MEVVAEGLKPFSATQKG